MSNQPTPARYATAGARGDRRRRQHSWRGLVGRLAAGGGSPATAPQSHRRPTAPTTAPS